MREPRGALGIRWIAALKARPALARLVTGIAVVVGAIAAVILQLLFWGWIARHTIAVDLPAELEVESAGRYYLAAEQRYYELVFTPSVSVVVAPTTPTPQIDVISSRGTISPCLRNAPLPDPTRLGYACPLSSTQSTIVAKGPRGSRRSAYVWSLSDHWPITDTDVLSRAVHLTLERRSARVEYTTWLSPGSAALDSLHQGDIPPGLFVKLVFYPDRDKFTGAEFYSISKALTTISETTATVTISGTLSGHRYTTANVSDVLGLSLPATGTPYLPPTTIVVQAEGMAVSKFDPPPGQKADRLLTWQSPLAAPSIVYGESDRFQTVADSVIRLREDIAGLRSKAGTLFSVPVILLNPIIPTLWLWWLARRGRYPAGFGWDRARPALVLSGLIWLVSFVSMVLAPFAQIGASPEAKAALGDLAFWASSLAVAGLALPVYWRTTMMKWTRVGGPIWLRGAISVVVLYWLIAILALRSNDLLRRDALLALMGMALLLITTALAWLPGQGETSLRGMLRSLGPGTWALAIGVAAVLAYPSSAMQSLFYPLDGWPVAVWRDLLFPFAVYLLPYVPLAILLTQMRAHQKEREPLAIVLAQMHDRQEEREPVGAQMPAQQEEREAVGAQLVQGVGHLLFAFYLVGATRGLEMGGLARDVGSGARSTEFNVIPVAFILAWTVAYRWLIPARGETASMANLTDTVYAHRDQLIKYVLDVEWAEKARDKRFDESTDSGEYEAAKEQFNEYLTGRYPACLSKEQAPQKVLFACGPRSTDWENAMLGVRRGLVLMVPLLVIYSPPLLAQAIRSVETAYLPLQLITRYLAPILIKWIFYSFFLGYFFRYIRGCNGWQKGLSLAVALLFCTLVHDVLVRASTNQDLLALALDAAQTVLFLTILGLWAYDYQTLRDHGYGWRRLLIVHNVAFLGSYVSSVLVALGTVIATAIAGKLTPVVIAFLNLVVPGIEAQ